MSEELYKQMAQSIIDGDSDLSIELAKKSIELNMHPLETITNGFVVGVNYIGDQFGAGEAFLPELVMRRKASRSRCASSRTWWRSSWRSASSAPPGRSTC